MLSEVRMRIEGHRGIREELDGKTSRQARNEI